MHLAYLHTHNIYNTLHKWCPHGQPTCSLTMMYFFSCVYAGATLDDRRRAVLSFFTGHP